MALVIVGTGSSASALQRELRCRRFRHVGHGLQEFISTPTVARFGWRRPRAAGDVTHVIYWGSAHHIPAHASLNRAIVFNKRQQLIRFHRSEVSAPLWITTTGGALAERQWLLRRFYHMGGQDIAGVVATTRLARAELANGGGDYAVEFIDKTHEWRVHVFRGEVLRIARKVWDETRGPQPEDPAWNVDNGYKFRYQIQLQPNTRTLLEDLALRALVSLRMDFGAVDIIGRRYPSGRWGMWVLEVNSAPGIADNQYTLEAYVQAIRRWVANGNGR